MYIWDFAPLAILANLVPILVPMAWPRAKAFAPKFETNVDVFEPAVGAQVEIIDMGAHWVVPAGEGSLLLDVEGGRDRPTRYIWEGRLGQDSAVPRVLTARLGRD